MRALLLAAGMGSRLRPLTDTTPKCLVRMHGRPLLDYWLELVFEGGVERALVNTHWLADQVRAHVAASRWAVAHRSGPRRRTARNRRHGAGQPGLVRQSKPFLVAHADNLTDFDVPALSRAHRDRPAGPCDDDARLPHRRPRAPAASWSWTGKTRVLAFHEKVENPPGNLANGAVYIFEPEVIDDIASLGQALWSISPPKSSRTISDEFYAWRQPVITGTSATRKACAGRILSLSTSRAMAGC